MSSVIAKTTFGFHLAPSNIDLAAAELQLKELMAREFILKRKLERGQSIEQILAVSAAPGYSEHHSGRALDLTTPGFAPLEEEFERSAAFAWLCTNSQRYNFHLSFPRGNVHAIAYEPWHWCWRGKRAR